MYNQICYQQKRYRYLNNGENKTKSDFSPHFGSSIRMHINVVFPANLSVIFCLIATLKILQRKVTNLLKIDNVSVSLLHIQISIPIITECHILGYIMI